MELLLKTRAVRVGIVVLVMVLTTAISGCKRSSASQRVDPSSDVQAVVADVGGRCDWSSSDVVEQVMANPQGYAHRMVTLQGIYLSGFERSSLLICAGGHTAELWLEDAYSVFVLSKLNERQPPSGRWDVPILNFNYNEGKNAAAWGKLRSEGDCSDATLVGQFETTAPKTGGFGHLGAYKQELILFDVLYAKTCEYRRLP